MSELTGEGLDGFRQLANMPDDSYPLLVTEDHAALPALALTVQQLRDFLATIDAKDAKIARLNDAIDAVLDHVNAVLAERDRLKEALGWLANHRDSLPPQYREFLAPYVTLLRTEPT